MPNKTWKSAERRIARMFGSERNPLSGIGSRHTASDSLHPRYFIETKMRKKIPFKAVFAEAVKLAKKEGKIPMLVAHETGNKYEDDLIFMRLGDFINELRRTKEC